MGNRFINNLERAQQHNEKCMVEYKHFAVLFPSSLILKHCKMKMHYS